MKKISSMMCMLFLSLGISLHAQTTNTGILKGVVKDYSGSPLPFAQLTIQKNGNLVTGAVADIDGIYTITNVSFGKYDVIAKALGLPDKKVPDVEIRDSIVVLDFAFDAGMQLQTIAYCMSTNKSVKSQTYSRKDIKKLSSRDVLSVTNATGSATIRGSRGESLVFIDGVKATSLQIPSENNTNEYADFVDNDFLSSRLEPLSTFSVDVDKASYSLVRKFIKDGIEPPRGAVRLEEMVNYFDYNYPDPNDMHPFRIITELTECPWNKDSKILKLALQGKRIPKTELAPSVFTFLIDVSGSMQDPSKLPLVKASLLKLLENLRPQDKVGIVVYAGAAGVVLEPRSAGKEAEIVSKIMAMEAGGSTAGGQGIQLAYNLADQHFIKDGNNRIILCTDGDFNVGISSDSELGELIEKERAKGIFLTVLGYGMGNYKDKKLELLADKGNGNYAYIDDYSEAEKFLGQEFAGSMYTIAKDVKIQVEFNPEHVKSYRLIGYENRVLAAQDFNDDKKDAGEIGAGHTVTALYEIRADEQFCKKVDSLKYQKSSGGFEQSTTSEVATIKFRYKKPEGDESILISKTLDDKTSIFKDAEESTRFAVAVAAFGMTLRKSEYIKDLSLTNIIDMALEASFYDKEEHRAEFISMMRSYKRISGIAKK